MPDDISPAIRPNAADHAASGLQALTSLADIAVPGIGSFFGLLVGQVIPNQRNERMAEFITRLSRRLRIAEEGLDALNQRYSTFVDKLGPEQRALFEDGAYASARATSTSRIDGISKVVADGLNADEATAIQQRMALQLISELSEEDVIVLLSYSKFQFDNEWRGKQGAVLAPIRAHMSSEQADLDRQILRELRTHRLLSLGVLREKLSANNRMATKSISPLGRYALTRLGLLEADDH